LCKAAIGWDGPTGIGTPNGMAMAEGSTGNDFSLSASSVTVAAGGSGTSTITTAVTSGSAETVTLAVSGLPPGVTAPVVPSSITSGGSTTATVTVGSTVAPGSYTLTVTGTAASGSHMASFTLTVVEGPPTITSFSPTSGPVGTVITINGTNLEGAIKVTFKDLSGIITKDSDGKIKVKVPVGATTGKIKVVTPGGSVKTATVFSVN
jgi:hypothetical protein